MKRNILLIIGIAISTTIFAQSSPHNILRKYKNDDGVISVKFDGDVMELLNSKDGEEIKSELEFMEIILFREGTDISKSDEVNLKSGLEAQNYELLINAKEGKNRVKVMGLDEGDTLSQVYVNAKTEKGNVYVIVKGKLFFEELKNLNLDKIDKFLD